MQNAARSALASPTLHHLALGAHDVEGVAAFYRTVFLLPEVARHAESDGPLRSIWLGLGSSVLMIERSTAEPRRVEGIGSGLFLLAFHIAETERASWEERLLAAGAAIESRTAKTSYARDPEGNRVAVSFYPLAAA